MFIEAAQKMKSYTESQFTIMMNINNKQPWNAYNCPAEGGVDVHGPLTKCDSERLPVSPGELLTCSG